jgi:hypothetical protein
MEYDMMKVFALGCYRNFSQTSLKLCMFLFSLSRNIAFLDVYNTLKIK